MKEIWKDVEGYEGLYQVSDLGRIKSLGNNKLRKERILKQQKNTKKYYKVTLSKNATNKQMLISRLVAMAFIPNPENKRTVNHKKGIITDNRASQLEWMTYSENHIHAFRVLGRKWNSIVIEKINESKIRVVKTDQYGHILKIYPSTQSVKKDGYDQGYISKACNSIMSVKNPNKAYGFYWKFAKDNIKSEI